MKIASLLPLFSLMLLIGSCGKKTLFENIPSSHSGIHFNNQIIENDSINELDIENVYNGGGVGIGDFNNDGLPDIYFTGNLVSNKLYLNKGNFVFDDVTDKAKVTGEGNWCRGVAVVDINGDGLPDIYVCATLKKNPQQRKNLLYINQGAGKDKIPVFKEMAAAYGLDDSAHSTQAAFFDYDNDGDLDVYVVTNEINKAVFPDNFHTPLRDGSNPSTGKLYRNDWDDSLGHPVFTDVSKQAGIQTEGYGHAVSIADINNDGWKDIYVTNDFISNDLLWINNHNGTFSEQLSVYFKHTSANAMGNDIADINNDCLQDVITLDMNPADNYRKKMMMLSNGYQKYQNSDFYGYNYQYVRNTLQLNQGPRIKQQDTLGPPIFSEIAFHAGIAETDWSWDPMVTDFDNDGYRDIIITNGFPKDITDHDFGTFRQNAYQVASKKQLLSQIPEVKLHNYAFRNNTDCSFSDVSANWGLSAPTFSNGAAYADLDNDGDLDLIINNINDEALVYRNTEREKNKENTHYLQVQFMGTGYNTAGLGATAEIRYDHGKKQIWENSPFRGYLSSIDDRAHFGLGNIPVIDSLLIVWPGGKMQVLQHITADQIIKVNVKDAVASPAVAGSVKATGNLFTDITDSSGIHYLHTQKDFVDFNIQKLLPHKFSEYGPGMAVGDVDGNGLDDIIIGGAIHRNAQVLLQQPDGHFNQSPLLSDTTTADKNQEDTGLLLFDANGDGYPDLYIASGGYEYQPGSAAYADKLYINDGKGHFNPHSLALPVNYSSKFCVRATDFDKDGDLDLFISGRVDPWNYPKPVSSFIYRNDSKNGHVVFTDVTKTVAKDLLNTGLVCDALFTDFDNDGWPDLLLAGEWMPVTFLKNDKGVFKNITGDTGVGNQVGWWNSITAGDFDNDGDIDYVIGNLGTNSFYKATDQFPVAIYAKDFDNNGSFDAFPALFLPASQQDQTKRLFPAQTRDDIVKQMIGMRSKFQDYKSFAVATVDQLFTPEQLKGALVLKANNLSSCYMKNNGNGKFELQPLSMQAQLSVINGMVTDDVDQDGNLDIIMNGNDYGTEVTTGRYDAFNGLMLKGDGKGGFLAQSILQSGIYIPGNGKSLVKLRGSHGNFLLAASQNRGPLKMFQLKTNNTTIDLKTDDAAALLTFKNGAVQKQEFYFGSSFLSQSARFIHAGTGVKSVTITTLNGKQRTVQY